MHSVIVLLSLCDTFKNYQMCNLRLPFLFVFESDSQANEGVLNKLKSTLEEQEQVMSMQEAYMKEKEDELAALTSDLESVNMR